MDEAKTSPFFPNASIVHTYRCRSDPGGHGPMYCIAPLGTEPLPENGTVEPPCSKPGASRSCMAKRSAVVPFGAPEIAKGGETFEQVGIPLQLKRAAKAMAGLEASAATKPKASTTAIRSKTSAGRELADMFVPHSRQLSSMRASLQPGEKRVAGPLNKPSVLSRCSERCRPLESRRISRVPAGMSGMKSCFRARGQRRTERNHRQGEAIARALQRRLASFGISGTDAGKGSNGMDTTLRVSAIAPEGRQAHEPEGYVSSKSVGASLGLALRRFQSDLLRVCR